jgi:hypothetical protein
MVPCTWHDREVFKIRVSGGKNYYSISCPYARSQNGQMQDGHEHKPPPHGSVADVGPHSSGGTYVERDRRTTDWLHTRDHFFGKHTLVGAIIPPFTFLIIMDGHKSSFLVNTVFLHFWKITEIIKIISSCRSFGVLRGGQPSWMGKLIYVPRACAVPTILCEHSSRGA